MNTMLKRIVSMFLCFVLVAGYLPAGALAAETEETVVTAAAEATNAPSVVELSDEATVVVEEEAAEAEENEEESLTADTGAPEEAVSEENTSEEAPAEEETSDEVTSEEETSEEEITEEETSEEATEEAAAFVLEAAPVDVSLLDAEAPAHVDAAIFFSDLHTNKSDYKESTVKGIMNGLNSSGLKFSSVTSCGDAFSVNEDSSSSNGPYTGYTSKLTSAIQSVLGNVPVNYVWSDHDRYAVEADNTTLLNKTSRLVYGAGNDGVYGTDDDGNYYVYSLSMGDLCSYDRYNAGFNTDNGNDRASKGFTATVQQAVENFQADAAKLKKDRPLFIASHQPLFDKRNDNAFAELWFDAINEVATGMDVAFFYGHNHKYDEGNDYYYAKGSTMPVTTTNGWNGYQTGSGYQYTKGDPKPVNKTLNFTHMCAGYLAPSSTGSISSTTREGTAVAVTIFEDSIQYVTYNANGKYNGDFKLDATVTRDHAKAEVEEPTEPSQPVTPEVNTVHDKNGTGITVTAPGVTGVSASVLTAETGLTEAQAAVSSVISGNVVAYDIRVEGFVNNSGTASVTLPIPAGMDAAKFVVYHVAENGAAEKMTGAASSDGTAYTFETDHFSVFVGGEKVSDNTQVDGTYTKTGNLPGATVYKLDTDGVENNAKYLIVNKNSGAAVALRNNNGTKDKADVTITDGTVSSGFDYEAASVWTFTASGNKWYIANGNQRIRLNKNDILNSSGQELTVSHQGNGAYRIKGDYYLKRGGNWELDSNAANLYLFKQETTAGTSVTFTLEAPAALTTNDTTYDLTYKIELGQGTVSSQEITWTSEDNAVVTVANGVLTVKGEGTTNIKAKLTRVNGTGLVEAIELTVPVTVSVKQITSIQIVPETITVFVGTNLYKQVATLVVTYEDGTTSEEPLTLHDLGDDITTDAAGSIFTKTITRSGKTATATVKVIEKVVNNYPEYPDEGAVKVSKTGTGIDFQSSGIAQVEVSASGVPMKRGVDVIVMLDTSSSMARHIDCGEKSCNDRTCSKVTRMQELRNALQKMEDTFKMPNDDGSFHDIRVAMADFNGYFSDSKSPYFGNNNGNVHKTDQTEDKDDLTGDSKAKVFTGSGKLDAGAFVNAATLDTSAVFTAADSGYTGTNYDYAFDAIYQLGQAIKAKNDSEGVERDLYVIFMSDGAPNQYNYYGSIGGDGGSNDWEYWLTGAIGKDVSVVDLDGTVKTYKSHTFKDIVDCQTHTYYFDQSTGNQHRMANAVKGDPGTRYEIIRKATGLTGMESAGKDNLYTIPGLGATMYSIAFAPADDGPIDRAAMLHVLRNVATTKDKHYYEATEAGALAAVFDTIAGDIAYAAYNARFVDQMGANYNLQMKTSTYKLKDGTEKTLAPQIEIRSYDIYTKADAEAGKIPQGSNIGDRKGTYTVLETVTFSADGSAAYSNLIDAGKTNILADGTEEGFVEGVIYANTFLYNTNHNAVAVNGVNIPTGKDSANLTTGSTNELPAETFYWKMGTVQSKELAMRYHVYLEGSMEGTREAGSYPTNEFATLYYDNYVHKPCYKETVSPVLAWKEANVSYAFYLVNENGEIIVNQNTGETGSFANKIAVTNPVVYKTVILNSGADVEAKVLAGAEDVLPKYYTLYDEAAAYQVKINSNGTGSWAIIKGGDVNASTYVTQYKTDNPAAYSKELNNNETGDDYTHTVVWFAVVWSVGAYPDSVVIDYGLPVEISVLTNDMFGDYGSLAGVGDYNTEGLTETGHTPSNVLSSQNYTGTFGTATANAATGKIRYELNKSNGMQMNTYEKFGYAVNYLGSNPGYYYSSVTVIPATTIYYEDDFLTYDSFTWDKDTNGWVPRTASLWSTAGNVNDNATQAEDRPGKYALQDANNIYGYDNVNLKMTQYSLGSAAKATVDYDNYAQASFTFCGTGFDVISMTSNMTGLILVDVQKYENNQWTDFAHYTVDTYYGYKQVPGDADKDGTIADGELIWVVDPDANGSLYQVPVIKMANKPYGQYRVTIKATYEPSLDHVENSESYDFYLDAIRIYDPANDGAADGTNDKTVENAYVADGEGWPSYIELRNNLIAANNFNATVGENVKVTGAVFIDGDPDVKNNQIEDYISYGPNNEVYLKKGQSVAFILDLPGNIANVHIGIKSADGNPCTYTVANYAQKANSENGVAAGQKYHERTSTVNTTTDMYYDLTDWRNDIIVITNNGDGILSLTNIKSTYKSDPAGNETQNVDEPGNNETQNVDEPDNNENGIAPASFEEEFTGETRMYMTTGAAALTLRTMNAPAEEEIPEPSVPESSEPEKPTVPEETKPAEPTIPEETKPVKPDNSELKAAVEAARKIKQKGHTQASFKKLQTAIKAAEKVLKDKKATQAQIDKALDDLNAAVDGLETVAVNPIKPKPGGSNGKIKNNFKAMDSIADVFRNLLKGIKR